MKTKINFLMLLLFLSSVGAMSIPVAPNVNMLNILQSKAWTIKPGTISLGTATYVVTYTSTNTTSIYTYEGQVSSLTYKFYLSDSPDASFNESLLGAKTTGKYMVKKNTIIGDISVYEIIQITDTYIKMVYLKNGTILEYVPAVLN